MAEVSVDELLAIIGRLHVENGVLRRRIGQLESQIARPPTRPAQGVAAGGGGAGAADVR